MIGREQASWLGLGVLRDLQAGGKRVQRLFKARGSKG